MNNRADKAIGLFDSGLGGLTVVKALQQKLPHEKLIYFGDTARVPYGSKSRETILRYSIENAIFLLDKDIKLLVVACNTASAFAVAKLQHLFSIPVIGVIEAGAHSALQVSQTMRIGVLGTQGTIGSGAYQEAIRQRQPTAEVFAVPCPLFVPLVEEKFSEHPAARLIVQEYLKELHHANVDTLLLGCTHYPVLRDLIQEEVGKKVNVVDSATTCAEMVERKLAEMQLLRSARGHEPCKYYVSDDPNKFRRLAKELLGEPLEYVYEHSHVSG